LHGEAVAIGMAIESYLSLILKRISKTEFEKIIFCLKLNYQFPKIEQKDLIEFYKYFKQDKKHKNNTYLLALLKGIGKCDFDVKINQTQLEKAIVFYNTKIADAS